MNRISLLILIGVVVLLGNSCEKEEPIPYKDMIMGNWTHDSTVLAIYLNGEFQYDRASYFTNRFVRFSEVNMKYGYTNNNIDYVTSINNWRIEESSIVLTQNVLGANDVVHHILTLTSELLVYQESYEPWGMEDGTTFEKAYYLSGRIWN